MSFDMKGLVVEDEDSIIIDYVPRGMMDTRTGHLDDVLMEKLEDAFHHQTSQILVHNVAKIASEHDPIDLAHAVTRLPSSERIVVYENLRGIQDKIAFIINTGKSTRAAIFRLIDNGEIVRLVERMPPDEAVWVLEDLSDRRLKQILDLLEPKKSFRIRELQRHKRHSAGRIMTNEFFAFPMDTTIKEAATMIRDNPGIDLTRSVFVLAPSGELAGYAPERNLIVNQDNLPLRQVMRPILHKVTPETPRDEVVDIVERYKVGALPVVDEQNRLVGVIAYEDVVEAMEDIADETIANIAGTAEDVTEQESIYLRALSRSPWLIVTLCAGLVNAMIMSHYSSRYWMAFIPFFVPLITGMSGNVGLQCSTFLVRWMATGELSAGKRKAATVNQLMMGMLIGLVFGLLCGTVVMLIHQFSVDILGTAPYVIAVTVAAGVFGACMTATVLGTFSPFFFARAGIDPAVASGPIVTAFNDVLSTLMFFLIAFLVNNLFRFL